MATFRYSLALVVALLGNYISLATGFINGKDAAVGRSFKTVRRVVEKNHLRMVLSELDLDDGSSATSTVISPVTTTATSSSSEIHLLQLEQQADEEEDPQAKIYRNGLITVGVITVLFASNSPVLHAAYVDATQTPPVLLLNAAVSMTGLAGAVLGGKFLDKFVPPPSLLEEAADKKESSSEDDAVDNDILSLLIGTNLAFRGGLELGMWKFLGTTANMFGLSMTSADHGAFLIQLTTLFVPLAQGIMGVPIPTRIWTAIGLALSGVAMFVNDPSAGAMTSLQGDALCVLAAVFYATYDLRLFKWGKLVAPLDLITTKIGVQFGFSLLSLVALGGVSKSVDFLTTASAHDLELVTLVVLWSGLAVNGIVPYLQVGGQQAVGPARAQILYASQPLWAAIMSLIFLGETVGSKGFLGGAAFLSAMLLAATAEVPDADCEEEVCEV